MQANIHSLYQKLSKGDLVETLEGEITSDLITVFLDKAENSLMSSGVDPKKTRKIYNVLVEALQNLFHHQEIPSKEILQEIPLPGINSYVFCVMAKEDNGSYRITCGNFVFKTKTHILKDRMDQLNSLSQDELKKLYKKVLGNNEFSEKGGGGLGFIEMARKSGCKFVYDFIDVDKKFDFFVLEVLVS